MIRKPAWRKGFPRQCDQQERQAACIASLRNNAPVADVPGAQLRFNKVDMAQAPTKGRVLDHIGFDVKDLQAFIKKLEANGIKLDRPYTKNEQTGAALAFITDPWGTYIELNERPNPAYIN
jgi:hypothetical protein